MGGRPFAIELESACSSLGLGRSKAELAWASKRGAKRKFSKLKTLSMVVSMKVWCDEFNLMVWLVLW